MSSRILVVSLFALFTASTVRAAAGVTGDALREPSLDAWLIAGYWALKLSVLALGRCFGVLPEARGLVTRGPYRLVRHPVYLGEIAACVGLLLAAFSVWNVGCFVVLCAAQWVRMGLEERALEDTFPEYAAYAARTPRLIPWTAPTPSAAFPTTTPAQPASTSH